MDAKENHTEQESRRKPVRVYLVRTRRMRLLVESRPRGGPVKLSVPRRKSTASSSSISMRLGFTTAGLDNSYAFASSASFLPTNIPIFTPLEVLSQQQNGVLGVSIELASNYTPPPVRRRYSRRCHVQNCRYVIHEYTIGLLQQPPQDTLRDSFREARSTR